MASEAADQRACGWVPAPQRRGRRAERNVGGLERVLSGVGGGLLAVQGLADLVSGHAPRGVLFAALGTLLARRAATGHCALYDYVGVSEQDAGFFSNPLTREVAVEHSVTIQRPADELYAFWRDFSNLPLVMQNLESVQMLDEYRSRWVACGPGDEPVEWEAHITHEAPGERIEWQSAPGAAVENRGGVYFQPAGSDRGTVLTARLYYRPPAGLVGAAIAKLLGRDPQQQIADDLRRFKQLLEAGEIASARSPSGRDPRPVDSAVLSAAHPQPRSDPVQVAAEESFPASDPPSWTPGKLGPDDLPPITGTGKTGSGNP